jgi:adenylate cyclase
VVGYSRLIRADEEGTLLALRTMREKLIDPKIKEHRGRTVKLMGDGMLVEFASVVDAVACSVQVQQALAVRNSSEPSIVFRVGINLGDVVIDGDDTQGDGVMRGAHVLAHVIDARSRGDGAGDGRARPEPRAAARRVSAKAVAC